MTGGSERRSEPGPAHQALSRALAGMQAHEARVRAWAFWDPRRASAEADALDRLPPGPLSGLSIGLKDIIDTADMPTENGTVLHAGRRPTEDAQVVTMLRQRGALILGKTVTTELATYAPGITRNPWNENHTPGGSSSGSAAAVACGMADLALGSQTNGSTIRPASFCGVVGFKPSRDRIPRRGMLVQSPTFDTVGLFAPDVAGVERLYLALIDGATDAQSRLAPGAAAHCAWWPTPWWARVPAPEQERLLNAARSFTRAFSQSFAPSFAATGVDAPSPWDSLIPAEEVVALHGLIMEAEIARSFHYEFEQGRESLSASLQGQITRGRATSDEASSHAMSRLMGLREQVDRSWPADVQAIMMPASTGTAPLGLSHTGDPIMCTVATALDLPAISLPGLRGENGLPLGIQLVGRRGCELDLLQLARNWESSVGS